MFVDRVILEIKAGKGGNGVIAWRREKYIPKGGPYGGDGGKGGSVVLVADTQIPSLEAYRNRRLLKAKNGQGGGPNNRRGKGGEPLVLKVPLGTLVKDAKTGAILRDLTEGNTRYEICKGGKGGKGNTNFKSPTNRAPAICTPGKAGESIKVELELKLIADVGLVGFPNAGKSTLLHSVTDIPVKMAPYPFTTLRPHLGYVYIKGGDRFLLADIPGIIKGASDNRGLGYRFLRHIERTHLLLFVLDSSGIDGRDPTSDFTTLRKELEAYDKDLLEKPFLVALNKTDTQDSEENIKAFKKAYPFGPETLFEISAINKQGVAELMRQAWALKSQAQQINTPCE